MISSRSANYFAYQDPDYALRNCYEELDRIRCTIIRRQRILILYPLKKLENPPVFFPKNKMDFMNFISKPPEATIDLILPQHVQFISKLYEFLIHSPVEFAKIAVHAHNVFDQTKFTIFIRSVVPSVFGFYSCSEHLQFALQFFIAMISSASKSIVFIVLSTFFQNASTFRFIESITNELIDTICIDMRASIDVQNVSERLIKEYAKEFHRVVMKNLFLLSSVHLRLLKYMRNSGYSVNDVMSFVFKDCAIPLFLMQLKASPFSGRIPLFQRIFEQFRSYEYTGDVLSIETLFDMPSAFTAFSHPYLDLLVSPYDTALLLEASQGCVELPRLLKMLMNPGFESSVEFGAIWLKVFPKRRLPNSKSNLWDVVFDTTHPPPQRRVFPRFERRWQVIKSMADEGQSPMAILEDAGLSHFVNEEGIDVSGVCDSCVRILDGQPKIDISECCETCRILLKNRPRFTFADYARNNTAYDKYVSACKFEDFLNDRLSLEALGSFAALVHDNFTHVRYLEDEWLIKCTLTRAVRALPPAALALSPEATRLFFAKRARILIEGSRPRIQSKCAAIERMWQNLMSNAEAPIGLRTDSLSKRKAMLFNRGFLQLSSRFNYIYAVPFEHRFAFILDTLRAISNLVSPLGLMGEATKLAVALCTSKAIVTTVIFIAASLMKKPEFAELLQKEDASTWLSFEGVVVGEVEKDPKMFELYMELHDFIATVAQ